MSRVPTLTLVFFCMALLAASQSPNIIRIGEAHPVAIAAWRLMLAALLLLPLSARQLLRLADHRRRDVLLIAFGGVLLAAHFITWIAAVQKTTVANATLLFAINPIITAVGGKLLYRDRLGKNLLFSVVLALSGMAIVSGSGLRFGASTLAGDLMALLASLLFAAYALLGRGLRRVLPNTLYVTCLYTVAGLVCLAVLLALRLPLVDYDPRTWLCFVLMAALPTLVGHTGINHALKYIDAGRISVAILTEPLLASLVAWWAWGEPISVHAAIGYGLIVCSVVVLVGLPSERR